MRKIPEKKWVLARLIISGLVLLIVAFTTEIPEGRADNYAHFNIARWAFRYPHLFLDHWGKPVFTILSAPFAQFGFVAVRIFNTICGLLTAWYAYKLAGLFHLKFSWFATVVVIFTPIYFLMMSTGMTEVIFSLILVVSVYLFFKEKYYFSALTVSFIFLARTEGLIFLLLFLISFILKKQYKSIPFLATGFLVFSLIGWVYHYHDFLWLINEMPYARDGQAVYGSGTWYHFFITMPNYFGILVPLLLLAGTVFMLSTWLGEKEKFHSIAFLQILLILGTFWGYFFAHTFLWWRTETSAGLQRVMAGVSPMIGIMAVFAADFAAKHIRLGIVKIAALTAMSVFLVFGSVNFYKKSIGYDLSAEVQKRTVQWLKTSGSLNHKLVMHNPYFSFATEIDAWDTNVVQYGFSNNDAPEIGLPDSTIFIWDAHFSANEGRLPLEKIMNNPNFEVVQLFEPVVPFKVFGENEYRIIVFRKIANKGTNNILLIENLKKSEIEKGIYFIEQYDFDNSLPVENMDKSRLRFINDSLNVVYEMNGFEFSPAFHISEDKIKRDVKNKFRITADICHFDSIGQNRLLMVFSAEINNQSYHYVTADFKEQFGQKNNWCKTEFVFTLPEDLKKGTVVKSYIWNLDKKNVLMDNFKIEISKQVVN